MFRALICPSCGGPLPSDARDRVQCSYCRVWAQIESTVTRRVDDSPPLPPPAASIELRHTFFDSVKDELQRVSDPRAALRTALASHFGSSVDAETVIAVTLALANDVQSLLDVDVSEDANALCRLAEAYLRAQAAFARGELARIELPFIAATPAGPVHYQRTLSLEQLRAVVAHGAPTPIESPWWKFW